MTKTSLKVSEIKNNPNNPRLIKDDKFKKLVASIKEFPEMLDAREIVVNEVYVKEGKQVSNQFLYDKLKGVLK